MSVEHHVIFQGELQMLAWGESMQAGAWVKFQVHPEDLESFKLMRAKVGKTPGQRLGAVMVHIDESEAVVPHGTSEGHPVPPAPKPPAPPPIGDLGRRAVLWCKDYRFQLWVGDQLNIGGPATEAECKEFILDEIGATVKYGRQASRKHIDADKECEHLFHERIRIPYSEHYREKGYRE